MNGDNVVSALKRKFGVTTDRALAKRVGVTTQAIQNWKNREALTVRQVCRLVHSAERAGAVNLQAEAFRPLVEFFPIKKVESKQRVKYELFTAGNAGAKYPYFIGLRDELDASHGVYIFFDSRGRAIYIGKARRQTLWKEMKLAFNRERGDIQAIKRVRHPTRKQVYRNSEEKSRQIVDHAVPLHQLATYFSAYQIADGMINELEAMLVRSFANDLLNKRMERFGQQKRKRSG